MWKTTCANELVQKGYNQNFILWENNAFLLVPSNILSPPFQRKWTADKTQTEESYNYGSILEQKIKKKCIYPRRENMATDDSLMIFWGQLSFAQFNSSKRAQFWVKFNKFCEYDSGYCVRFKLYTSQDIVVGSNERTRDNAVMELWELVTNKG